MKKIILISTLFFSSISQALTEQVSFAEKYEFSKPVYNFSKNKITSEQQKIIDEYLDGYVMIKKDIGPSHKKHPLVFFLKYINGIGSNDLYDEKFISFVKSKQKENDLIPSGVLDPVTWFSIYQQPNNWQVETVSDAIKNWESILRKHSTHKNTKMIVVNVPSMTLFLYERTQTGYNLLLESRIIIGKPKTQTPLRDFEIISLKYNPTWTPTEKILGRNLYNEKGELNVEWIQSHGLTIYDEYGVERDIDELESIKNPKFIQLAGEDNALGNLKFETTSKDDVYLHDTNERFFFKHNTRTYSSGCIRVQNYMDLASIISGKTTEKIAEKIKEGETTYSPIKRVPVYLDYSQVRFKSDKKAVFYPDIYSKTD